MRFLSLIMGTKEKKKATVITDAEKLELTKEDVLKVMNKWKNQPHYVYLLPAVFFKGCKKEAIEALKNAGIIMEYQDGSIMIRENTFSCLNCIYYVSGDRYTRSKCLAKNEEMQMVGLEKGRFCPHFMNRKVAEVLKMIKR